MRNNGLRFPQEEPAGETEGARLNISPTRISYTIVPSQELKNFGNQREWIDF